MKVKVLELTDGIPLVLNEIYKVNFETKTHYIIFSNGVWCGIFKSNAKVQEGE
ncbi:hypothetical protein [Clostridium hydrogenum]|uniref:hypothetical protein n=1 Tax=Clostridium hydrogenum TaxID=2855764 RepID=UPI001F480468|nr:hypothetical protein [Clostridium hydrogenum]